MVRSTINPHLQLHDDSIWQQVHSELVAEATELAGVDMFYLPRRRGTDYDAIFHEDPDSSFDTAYQLPVYIKSSANFMGNESMMSEFGIEIRLQLIFSIATMHFESAVAQNEADIWRPQEGDLIYIPAFDHHTYEIKYVDLYPDFYQFGHVPRFDMTAEVFEYGNEQFTTGIEEIDAFAKKTSGDAYDWALLTEDDKALLTQDDMIITIEAYQSDGGQGALGVIDTNDEFEAEGNTIIDWSEDNPFGEGQW